MIPIGDDDSDHTLTPWINYLLVAINIAVFVWLQGMGTNEDFTLSYAVVPEEILSGRDVIYDGLGVSPQPLYITLITSIFLHGSWMHLLGNMLFLWIYGDNLENRLGHFRFLLYYLLCGMVASLAHILYTWLIGKQLLIPSLGASGAIAGIMGGYMLLYPGNRVSVLFIFGVIRLPAFITLGIWILMQLFNGYQSLWSDAGGVAYLAHIGGFFVGMLIVKLFRPRLVAGSTARLRT